MHLWKRRVSIVERHAGLAEMVAVVLRRSGHEPSVVLIDGSNGEVPAVVATIATFRPDAIVIGVSSRRGKAYQIAQLLRCHEALVGCLMIGLVVDPSHHAHDLGGTFDVLLPKPFEIDALRRALGKT